MEADETAPGHVQLPVDLGVRHGHDPLVLRGTDLEIETDLLHPSGDALQLPVHMD